MTECPSTAAHGEVEAAIDRQPGSSRGEVDRAVDGQLPPCVESDWARARERDLDPACQRGADINRQRNTRGTQYAIDVDARDLANQPAGGGRSARGRKLQRSFGINRAQV